MYDAVELNYENNVPQSIDVWVLRSGIYDSAAFDALNIYIDGWFRIRDWKRRATRTSEQVALAMRGLIVGAATTAIAFESYEDEHVFLRRKTDEHLIDGTGSLATELNIKKVNYNTHR